MLSPHTENLSYRRLSVAGRTRLSETNLPLRRVAILSDAASQQFVPLMRALLHENGFASEFYEGAFDAIDLEVLNPGSAFYSFQPDTVIVAMATQALRDRYFHANGSDISQEVVDRIQRVWTVLRSNSDALIIHLNYPMPYERFCGNLDRQINTSLYAVTKNINHELSRVCAAYKNIAICDVEGIAAQIGSVRWYDDRQWNMTKAYCRLEYLPYLTQNIVEMMLTTAGRMVKCLVLDLDNTLWGGVVGDLGHMGIEIAPHGDGEAFYHFQNYLLGLKRRGIILAVCSKNDLANAVEPFQSNPNMVLKRRDIAVFVANWSDKAENIKQIKETLNIGYDAIAFLDDNPFERNLVRGLLPEVIVPEMPEDPADYVSFVSGLNLFEAIAISQEDSARTEMYAVEAQRLEAKQQFSNVEDYLKSLEMQLSINRFDGDNLPRISQLMQRSNQFNVTTRRLSEAACQSLMEDAETSFPLFATLSDRFGDHGLITIVVMKRDSETLEITDWLMSCRVLARGVEETMMNQVVEIAQKTGCKKVRAQYIPTAKNGMVKDLFSRFGFVKGLDESECTEWELVPHSYQPAVTHIAKVETNV
jgi:FkbH-like protein